MYLYIVRLQEYHKIGITSDFKSRLSQLQTSSPFKIEPRYLFEFDEAGLIERVLHQRFYPKRASGEWFLLSIEDIEDAVFVCHRLGGKPLLFTDFEVKKQENFLLWLWHDFRWALVTTVIMFTLWASVNVALEYVPK